MNAVQDPSTCDHEWIDDGVLEVYPPIGTSHCAKCGLKRHINTATGATTYHQASSTPTPHRSVSRPPNEPEENG